MKSTEVQTLRALRMRFDGLGYGVCVTRGVSTLVGHGESDTG